MSYNVYFKDDEDGRFQSTLVIDVDGVIAEYMDGGEPEDNSFNRDWDWVPTELERAYKQGLKDGTPKI